MRPENFISRIAAAGILSALLLTLFWFRMVPETKSASAKIFAEKQLFKSKQDQMEAAMDHEVWLTQDPALGYVPRERLYIAYQEMLHIAEQLKSRRAAIASISWTERGPDNVAGRTRAILVDPNDATQKTVFAASVAGGLWKTSDISVAKPVWTAVDDFFGNLAICALAANPANPQMMYFGTGEGWYNSDAIRGDGIWKSANGGGSWTKTAFAASNYVHRIKVRPGNGHVYAATRDGLFRSTDQGTNWTEVLGAGNGSTSDRIADFEFGADTTIYASAGVGNTDGIYSSTTGNAGSWTKKNTGTNGFPTTGMQRIELAAAPSNANVLYAFAESSSGSAILNIYKTTNKGTTWTTTAKPVDADGSIGNDYTRGQAFYDLTGAVDPNNSDVVFTGGIDLFKSTNGGTSWKQLSHWYGGYGKQFVHGDQHEIVFQPGSSAVLYFGNDGGIYRSGNATDTMPAIPERNNGYNVTQFYSCAMHPDSFSNHFLAGAQDNGTQRFTRPGVNSTVEISDGDGMFCHIDQNEPQYQFSSYVYNYHFRSTDGGESFSSVSGGSGAGYFVNPSDYDDVSNKLYSCFSSGNFRRWDNPQTGNTFSSCSVSNFNSSTCYAVTVSPNTANRVFFGTTTGKIVRVDNANTGTNFSGTNMNNGAGMPSTTLVCIEVEKGNDNHILAVYPSYGISSIWETTDGGSNWVSVEGNLPDMPVRWALFNPDNSDQALIATELGVWTTDNLNGTGTVWGPSNTGLSNTRVDMLQIRNSDKVILAATHGRGLFTTDAFSPVAADFDVVRPIGYEGADAGFLDNSLQATSWAWNFGDGGTAYTENPVHQYTNPGKYNVTLAINSGASTKTRANIIHILPDLGTPFAAASGGDFESNTNFFGAHNIRGTKWALGNSTIAGKNGTHSGSIAWVTGPADNTYVNQSEGYLYCPNFNFSASGTYTLSFWARHDFENQWDGFNMQVSLDKGTTWTVLGTVQANWYNYANATQTTAFPKGEPFFTGNSAIWKQYSLDVSSFAGNSQIAFRFKFKTDMAVTSKGVAIDDFEISGPGNGSSPIAMTLGQLLATWTVRGAELTWKTFSEESIARFDIYRSEDGLNFESIGSVASAGNSSSEKAYVFTHQTKHRDGCFYRVKQICEGGSEEVTNVAALTGGGYHANGIASVYPNPFSGEFSIRFSESPGSDVILKLFDRNGLHVYSGATASGMNSASFSDGKIAGLLPGTYFLEIRYGNHREVRKIVKI